MKTKPDEIALMKLALQAGGPFKRCFQDKPADMNEKRFYFILEKWDSRGWFDSGVSVRTGWLTPEGVTALTQITTETSNEEV